MVKTVVRADGVGQEAMISARSNLIYFWRQPQPFEAFEISISIYVVVDSLSAQSPNWEGVSGVHYQPPPCTSFS